MAEVTSQTNVGIDVSKNWLDIVVIPSGETWRTENQEAAIRELIKKLEQLQPERIVVEATGGYEQMLAVQLYLAGLPLCRVNPKRTRYFARSLGQLAKTDALDGKVLALFGERVKPPLTRLPSEKEQVLSALITRREQISNFLVAERNRLDTAPKKLLASLSEHITWLKKELKQLEREIDDFVNDDPDFKEKSDLLVEVQGVGKKTAAKLIADVPELGDCDRKQIAAFRHHQQRESRPPHADQHASQARSGIGPRPPVHGHRVDDGPCRQDQQQGPQPRRGGPLDGHGPPRRLAVLLADHDLRRGQARDRHAEG